jgi:hypothetical protein
MVHGLLSISGARKGGTLGRRCRGSHAADLCNWQGGALGESAQSFIVGFPGEAGIMEQRGLPRGGVDQWTQLSKWTPVD